MRVRHPETIDGVGGHPPHSETLNGTIYTVSDGELDIPQAEAERLADLYGVDLADIRVDGDVAAEHVCEDCGESFDSAQALGAHSRSHNPDT